MVSIDFVCFARDKLLRPEVIGAIPPAVHSQWQNRMLAPPPGELAPSPWGNPGSATDSIPF